MSNSSGSADELRCGFGVGRRGSHWFLARTTSFAVHQSRGAPRNRARRRGRARLDTRARSLHTGPSAAKLMLARAQAPECLDTRAFSFPDPDVAQQVGNASFRSDAEDDAGVVKVSNHLTTSTVLANRPRRWGIENVSTGTVLRCTAFLNASAVRYPSRRHSTGQLKIGPCSRSIRCCPTRFEGGDKSLDTLSSLVMSVPI